MATLLIIDDHRLYLDGLEMALSKAVAHCLVLKASNAQEAAEAIEQYSPIDLILLDLHLPEQSGLALWQTLKKRFGTLPVAVLTASNDLNDVRHCHQQGGLGFINKSLSTQALVQAIESILSGQLYYPSGIPSDKNTLKLTPRQQDVLQLLAEGLPNKAICNRLDMSEATVKTHLRTLFILLDVNTRTQCVAVAQKRALL